MGLGCTEHPDAGGPSTLLQLLGNLLQLVWTPGLGTCGGGGGPYGGRDRGQNSGFTEMGLEAGISVL